MAVTTAAVLAGTAVAGLAVGASESRKASKAAKKAGEVQAESTELGVIESGRQFDLTRQDLLNAQQFQQGQIQPFQEAGVSALEQQRILLGLGSSQNDPNAERRSVLQAELQRLESGAPTSVPGNVSSRFTGQPVSQPTRQPTQVTQFQRPRLGGGRNQAADVRDNRAAFNADQVIREQQQQQFQSPNQTLGPNQDRISQIQSELGAIPEFTASGLTAVEEQDRAFQQLKESPGQQFIRRRQERALLRSSAAIGGLGGGNVRTALIEQGTGFAQQDIQNQFGRLGQLAGQGQTAGTNIGASAVGTAGRVGQFGQANVANISNLRVAGAEARASGIFGQQQARAQGTQQFFQAAPTAINLIDRAL